MKEAFKFCVFLVCISVVAIIIFCASDKDIKNRVTEQDNSEDIIWLAVDSLEDASECCVEKGTILVSEKLEKKLNDYSDETKFAVAICFKSMVSNDYLEEIEYEGKSAAKYLEESIELREQDEEVAKKSLSKYYELKYMYFEQLLDSLTYAGEKLVYGDSCKDNFFFYTYMTKREIQTMKCRKDEALYVFAPDMVK